MSNVTSITLPFADGEYRFWLALPQINELEIGGASICRMEYQLRESVGLTPEGEAYFAGGNGIEAVTVRDIIRQALIGGDHGIVDGEETEVGPIRAKQLVDAYVYPVRPLAEGAALAWLILATAIYGREPAKVADQDAKPEPQESDNG